MKFDNGLVKLNGELPLGKSIWDGLVPPMVEALLDNIAETGFNDGRSGLGARDGKVIESATRLRLTKEKFQKRGLYQSLQRKIRALEEKLKRLCQRIGHLHEMIEELRPKVKLGEALIYTAAGVIFFMGDLVFSHQLILQNFGLGRSEPYIWIPLVASMAMTTIFIKLAYIRFVESRYDDEAKVQPKVVKWFFLITSVLATLSFMFFGYVRGIGFKFSLLATEQDIYESLYQLHPYLNTLAFIAIAFLFLLGGSVLLAVGFKEMKKWSLLRGMIRELRKFEKRYAGMESHLNQLLETSDALEYLNTVFSDPKSFSETIQSQTEIYHSLYAAEYGKGMKEMLTESEGENSLDGNFNIVVSRALQHMAVNSTIQGGHQNGH